jgi:hypothetical protein
LAPSGAFTLVRAVTRDHLPDVAAAAAVYRGPPVKNHVTPSRAGPADSGSAGQHIQHLVHIGRQILLLASDRGGTATARVEADRLAWHLIGEGYGRGWCTMMASKLGRRARGLLIGIVLAGLVSAAGCGHSPSNSATASSAPSVSATPGAACQQGGTVNFDKTKFVLHAGLAFGAFHHFIYAPFKAGKLHGFAALAKAALAGLFTVHELKLAKADAESSPTLCHLAAPFDKASAAIGGAITKIKSGNATSGDIEGLDNDVNAVQNGATADGVAAPDQVPTDSQLTSGGS